MNHYTARFHARCPSNGQPILYTLTLSTVSTIMIERITAAVSAVGVGYHEDIADSLWSQLGGQQVIEADHHGVAIRTVRPMEHAA